MCKQIAFLLVTALFASPGWSQEPIDRTMLRASARKRSNTVYGFDMQGNAAAKAIFDAWLEPLRDVGARKNILEGIGATDHVPFDEAGMPAFTAIKGLHRL